MLKFVRGIRLNYKLVADVAIAGTFTIARLVAARLLAGHVATRQPIGRMLVRIRARFWDLVVAIFAGLIVVSMISVYFRYSDSEPLRKPLLASSTATAVTPVTSVPATLPNRQDVASCTGTTITIYANPKTPKLTTW